MYEKVKVIGAGGFGQVFLVRRTQEPRADDRTVAGQHYVIKRIFLQEDERGIRAAAVEVKVLQSIAPMPNIVSYYDHFVDDENYINIVMEYCALGDLDRFLNARRRAGRWPLSVQEVLYLTFQLLAGTSHLHESGVLHRDLKPANIFLTWGNVDHGGLDSRLCEDSADDVDIVQLGQIDATNLTLKVADFGISHVMQNTLSFANTVIGTPFYIAPEIVESRPYTLSADVWAVGCIVYEIASCGVRCFDGNNMLAVVQKISTGGVANFSLLALEEDGDLQRRRNLLAVFDEMLMPMVRGMLCVDAKERLSVKEILQTHFAPSHADYVDDFEDPTDYLV